MKISSSIMFKKIILFSIFLSLPVFAANEGLTKPLAYVYNGPGLCRFCSSSALHSMAEAGFEARPILPGEINSETLSQAALVVIPGGDDLLEVRFALKQSEMDAIQTYVEKGGHYLGICLGAFMADGLLIEERKVPGLNLFKGLIKPHGLTDEPRMEKIEWKGVERFIYFQEGPEFAPLDLKQVEVWARYSDGAIAALQQDYGKGRIGLIGPHPEADANWMKEDRLTDPDGSDEFLLTDFVRSLMNLHK